LEKTKQPGLWIQVDTFSAHAAVELCCVHASELACDASCWPVGSWWRWIDQLGGSWHNRSGDFKGGFRQASTAFLRYHAAALRRLIMPSLRLRFVMSLHGMLIQIIYTYCVFQGRKQAEGNGKFEPKGTVVSHAAL